MSRKPLNLKKQNSTVLHVLSTINAIVNWHFNLKEMRSFLLEVGMEGLQLMSYCEVIERERSLKPDRKL